MSFRSLDRNALREAKQRILDSRNELPLAFFLNYSFLIEITL